MPDPSSSLRSRRAGGLPDLRSLETFVVVCEAGSMQLAAERLGLSQSAVSQTVRTLELELGLQLMDREVRPARPTHAGRVLYESSLRLLSQARAMLNQVDAAARHELAQIRLGCVDSFAATIGPALIRALSGRVRRIRMWSGLTPALAAQMQSRELDLVICTEGSGLDARVNRQLLFSESWLAVFPAQPQLEALAAWSDLKRAAAALPLIRYSQRSVIGQQIDLFLRHVGVSAERSYEFDSTDPLLSLVASGLGWAVTTPLCVWQSRQYLPALQIMALPPSRLGQRHFFLLSREGEWEGLEREIARITQTVIRQETAVAIRREIPGLPDHILSCPNEE